MSQSMLNVANEIRVLLIEDDDDDALLILRQLGDHGFKVTADRVDRLDALRGHLANHSYDVIISDYALPSFTATHALQCVRNLAVDTPFVIVSGRIEEETAVNLVKQGACDFLNKDRLGRAGIAVESVILQRQLVRAKRAAQQTLEKRERDLQVSREATIERLTRAAEFRDDDTGCHNKRMSHYCGLLSEWAGLGRERSEMIRSASLMHDVGKIGIPDSILLKPGKLTAEEYALMQQHTEFGYRILSGGDSELLDLAATIAYTHHEKCDGSGYPRGLKGPEIPVEGRIAAVCDVFDALTTDRVYRKAFTVPEAVAIMKEGRGSHFDPNLLDIFLANLDEVVRARDEEELSYAEGRSGDEPAVAARRMAAVQTT